MAASFAARSNPEVAALRRDARFTPVNGHWTELLCRLIEPRVDLLPKQGEVDGFGKQPGCAAFCRLPSGFGITVGGDHDDGDVGSHLPDFGKHLKSRHTGHVDVR